MKRLLIISGRLLLSFIASSLISFISMFLCLSSDIEFMYKVLLGLFFVAFILIITFSSGRNAGESDFKKNVYCKTRGFFASLVTMIPALALFVYYLILSYKGWLGDNFALANGVYSILYLIFLAFSPVLSVLTSFNPALGVDLAQPAISYLKNISTPNAVSAPLFIIPIVLFIVTAGVGYLMGGREQKEIKDTVKKLKNNLKNN